MRFEKRSSSLMDWVFKIVPVFIAVIFVMVILWYGFIGIVAIKLVDKVQDDGLKSIVGDIWEGSDANEDR